MGCFQTTFQLYFSIISLLDYSHDVCGTLIVFNKITELHYDVHMHFLLGLHLRPC